ncbi:ABC transporter permease [Magnetospira sp. QH-2]|uniref:ABC transporter permease n=1 Tax=Magnetospira sp. (strain QH-2) TaxID=1288970 RepID=UPI0003E811EF|nr:ABC transporter permease subunit [Magnetospira sp. QH-2]CCQ74548.1 Taurine transport system subunit permease protein, membrane component of ABC superfamily [Magnetospira sp. QH-2]
MRRVINQRPGKAGKVFLTLLPFALLIGAYMVGSDMRLAENPNDKLLPSFSKIGDAIERMAFTPDKRTGNYLWWVDTASSLTRMGLGIGIATLFGLLFGVVNGLIPYVRATLAPLIAVLSLIPPMAILPVLFIVFGLGEVSKVVLIVIGIAPFLMRDMALRVAELPGEQIIKAQTLGASTWAIVVRVVLPQMLPRLIDSVRLALGPAWLFLIAAEAIAATDGLGYRIFLVRRYLAMDVILPYVAWITLLAFTFDWLLVRLQSRAFPWIAVGKERS